MRRRMRHAHATGVWLEWETLRGAAGATTARGGGRLHRVKRPGLGAGEKSAQAVQGGLEARWFCKGDRGPRAPFSFRGRVHAV
jgi:hypothetical protein